MKLDFILWKTQIDYRTLYLYCISCQLIFDLLDVTVVDDWVVLVIKIARGIATTVMSPIPSSSDPITMRVFVPKALQYNILIGKNCCG